MNLVVAEATSVVVTSASLFSLMNDIAVFFRESYQRMNVWSRHSTTMKRLGTIGETRWWSKDAALKEIFGIISLNALIADENTQPAVKAKVKGCIDSLLKFETAITAQVYLQIFSRTTVLSKYLQTVQLDLLTVHRMVEELLSNMKALRDDFETSRNAAAMFVQWANGILEESETDLLVEDSLPTKRQRRHKRMDDDFSTDETTPASDPVTKYRVEVYNRIVDTIVTSVEQRFGRQPTPKLFADLSLLHPGNFGKIPSGAMEELQKYLVRFDDSITAKELLTELRSLGEQWIVTLTVNSKRSSNIFQVLVLLICSSCQACPLCCYKVLLKLNLFTDAHKSIVLAYKLLSTLPVSQVACERSFSALKRIKGRLRSTMTQEHLEAFMLMFVEKAILTKLDNEDIIDAVAAKSKELRRLLLT